MWISPKYTYIPSLSTLPLTLPPSQPARSSEYQAELPVLDNNLPLAI